MHDAISCPQLALDGVTDWGALDAAFAAAPAWHFAQSWSEAEETRFRPGSVRIAWQGDRFHFLAGLTDDRIIATATRRNEMLWQMGDVLELFAGVTGEPGYIEYHTDPRGNTLQLRWPDAAALAGLSDISQVADYAVVDDAAQVRVRITASGWQLHGSIPASSLPGGRGPLAGQCWQVSFGRYDYHDMDTPPVLSCTSPLTRPAYHRRGEWRVIHFE